MSLCVSLLVFSSLVNLQRLGQGTFREARWFDTENFTVPVGTVRPGSDCDYRASSAYTGAAASIIEEFRCSDEVFLLGLSEYIPEDGLKLMRLRALLELCQQQRTD